MKPPYPTVAGAFGKPTVVNNVETFANVPVIVEKGAQWYSQVGAKDYPGTKVFSISGDVKRPGCYEVATGSSLNNVIDLAWGYPRRPHPQGGSTGWVFMWIYQGFRVEPTGGL